MKLSIITACFNSSAVIGDNLDSVRSQVGGFELEHLFQDGGSTDGTVELLADYQDRVDYEVSVQSKPDSGFYDAINKALGRATGEVVGLLNADDRLADSGLLKLIARTFTDDPDLDLVYGNLNFVKQKLPVVDGGSKEKSGKRFVTTRRWRPGLFTPGKFRRGWMPPHPTIYMRRRVLERVGEYRLDMGSAADYEWILRAFLDPKSSAGKVVEPSPTTFKYIPQVFVEMRLGGQSTSSLKNRLIANKMDRRAWEINGLKPSVFFRFLKPFRKLNQFFGN